MHQFNLSRDEINYLYEETPEKARMRKFIVDQTVWSSADDLFEDQDHWPAEFLQSVAKVFVRYRYRKGGLKYHDAPYFDDTCKNYHEHEAGFVRPCRSTLSAHEWALAIKST